MYWNESISIQILNGTLNAGAYPKIYRKVDVYSIRSKYWIAWVENLLHFNLKSQVLQAPESSLSFKIYIYIYTYIRIFIGLSGKNLLNTTQLQQVKDLLIYMYDYNNSMARNITISASKDTK